jgi:hypothetical protein
LWENMTISMYTLYALDECVARDFDFDFDINGLRTALCTLGGRRRVRCIVTSSGSTRIQYRVLWEMNGSGRKGVRERAKRVALSGPERERPAGWA